MIEVLSEAQIFEIGGGDDGGDTSGGGGGYNFWDNIIRWWDPVKQPVTDREVE